MVSIWTVNRMTRIMLGKTENGIHPSSVKNFASLQKNANFLPTIQETDTAG